MFDLSRAWQPQFNYGEMKAYAELEKAMESVEPLMVHDATLKFRNGSVTVDVRGGALMGGGVEGSVPSASKPVSTTVGGITSFSFPSKPSMTVPLTS